MGGMSPAQAAVLADAILALHVAVAAFVILATLAILAGGPRRWRWVRLPGLRIAHALLVAMIALQAWAGRLCPLTTWEQSLRNRAGQATYDASFIQHWLSRLIFLYAPWWVFVAAYSTLAALVAFCWWRWPPRGPTAGRASREPS